MHSCQEVGQLVFTFFLCLYCFIRTCFDWLYFCIYFLPLCVFFHLNLLWLIIFFILLFVYWHTNNCTYLFVVSHIQNICIAQSLCRDPSCPSGPIYYFPFCLSTYLSPTCIDLAGLHCCGGQSYSMSEMSSCSIESLCDLKGTKIVHVNIRSLLQHFDDVVINLLNGSLDIVV